MLHERQDEKRIHVKRLNEMNELSSESAINSKHSMEENEFFFWKRERKIDEFVFFIVEKYFMFMTLFSAHIIFGSSKGK